LFYKSLERENILFKGEKDHVTLLYSAVRLLQPFQYSEWYVWSRVHGKTEATSHFYGIQ